MTERLSDVTTGTDTSGPGRDSVETPETPEIADSRQQHRGCHHSQRIDDLPQLTLDTSQRRDEEHVVRAGGDDDEIGPPLQRLGHLIGQDLVRPGAAPGQAHEPESPPIAQARRDLPDPDVVG